MVQAQKKGLRALRSLRWMPLPDQVHVRDYGKEVVGEAHEVMLFPAVIRPSAIGEAGEVLEEGRSGCYFHPHLSATAICDLSGRLICELCSTQWQGKTVSVEALQGALRRGDVTREAGMRVRCDNIALSLAVLPLLLWFTTLLTAPATLFIVIWKGRKGACSVVQRSGWRYFLAALLAALQLLLWAGFVLFGIFG